MSATATATHEATLELARALIARPSVTPRDEGCLDLIASRLGAAGFTCHSIDRGGVWNLLAVLGEGRPFVCGAGHVDVVPPGPLDAWSTGPFTPAIRDGYLYGRGASDMKGPLAALVTALERIAAAGLAAPGRIGLIVTADEEGTAVDGTAAIVDWLRTRAERIDACLLAEPTSSTELGDTIKNGRRGSLNGTLRMTGVQGHIAYPHLGRNAIHDALPVLAELAAVAWDGGTEHFEPTRLQFSNVHAGTGAVNVMPGTLEAQFNVRFSPETPEPSIKSRVTGILDRHGVQYDLTWSLSGQPFLTKPGRLVSALSEAVRAVTGRSPALSTGGGTSDGRFLSSICDEVVEFGPSNETIHKVNERIALADLAPLSLIYERTFQALLE